MKPSGGSRLAFWAFTIFVLLFLYAPLVPPLILSTTARYQFGQISGEPEFTFRWYVEMWRNPILVDSFQTSVITAVIVGLITPALAILAAMAVRELPVRRLIVILMLLPLFVPGITMGLATAFFFRELGIAPSLMTIVVVHVIWALPFAFLIVLTVMTTFDPVLLEAAYMSGANRWRAFLGIELPLIYPGVIGAAIFSMIISFNETIRTTFVQGPMNTVQTYIWSTFKQIGLTPTLFALMGLLIIVTFALVLALSVMGVRQARREAAGG
jgi:ABC-type spermidine/putrescine transport system permease subunit II